MVERVSMRRTEEVRLKLGPDMLVRLNSLAEAHGFPVATMGAVAVAEWVVSKEQSQQNQRMMLLDMSRKMSGDMAEILAQVANDPAALAEAETIAKKAKDQLSLPLDAGNA